MNAPNVHRAPVAGILLGGGVVSDILTDPDFLAACEDARVLPERIFFRARTEERNVARRMVCCRLLHRGWKPGRVAKTLSVSTRQVRHWAKTCPVRFNVQAWKRRGDRPLLASLLNFRF